jgi:hypothetical protein
LCKLVLPPTVGALTAIGILGTASLVLAEPANRGTAPVIGRMSALDRPAEQNRLQSPRFLASAKHPWLYVGDFNNNVILIYDVANLHAPKPIGQLFQGLVTPAGMTLDAQGNLYVANQGGGSVVIYPPGASAPSLCLDLLLC